MLVLVLGVTSKLQTWTLGQTTGGINFWQVSLLILIEVETNYVERPSAPPPRRRAGAAAALRQS